ncbi:Mobile element protein [hydrothermal vent metagenome]|uniref:Mobile element protein n=1 Tax=hydrothermal vent metagenome TaxID=652676 RepID=A0A1W1C4G3_9ZZZZ
MFNYIGIDVSKATLQVYIPIKDENISIKNTKKSLISLYSKLKKYYKKESRNLVIIFEPTGSYSALLKDFCSEKNINAFIINPRQSANFAKALDNRSKSDIIDAEMLYKFHVMLSTDDIAVPIVDNVQEGLSEALAYYKFIQKERVSFSNHLESLEVKNGSTLIIKKLKSEIKHLKAEEEKMIVMMKSLVLSDKLMKEKFENISSIIGVGEKAAIVLIHLFITYPEANRQEIIALSGLDAIENTSGTSIQRRTRISKKGNSIYRSVLFMPVLSAIQHNPYMKRFYDRLKNNGKHSTVAQIAVMRKIILIAHSLYKNNVKFDKNIYEKSIGIKKNDV